MLTLASGGDPVRGGGSLMHEVLICLAMLMGLVALVLAAEGVAAITRGRLPARAGQNVERPHIFGWGMLVMAFTVASLAVGMVVFTDPIRSLARCASFGFFLLGTKTIRASRRPKSADSPGQDKFQPGSTRG
ncbi:hypothetical protein ACWEQ2_15020 [Streptomyces sp. NPDC004096]